MTLYKIKHLIVYKSFKIISLKIIKKKIFESEDYYFTHNNLLFTIRKKNIEQCEFR